MTIIPSIAHSLRDMFRSRLVVAAFTAVAVLSFGSAVAGAAGGGAHPDHITSLAGGDRYETAAEIALSIYDEPGVAPETLYIANGETGIDALALGGNLAPDESRALLLVTRHTVPSTTADALRQIGHAELVFLGGPDAISDDVRAEVASLTRNYAYPN